MATRPITPSVPLPAMTPGNAPFWEGCKAGELRLQKCLACGRPRYFPRPACPYCGAEETAWEAASGKGKVVSWVVCYHPTLPAFQDRVPYNVVLVELDEGVRMVSNLVGCANDEICDGMAVEVTFEPLAEEVVLPKFRPAPKGRPRSRRR